MVRPVVKTKRIQVTVEITIPSDWTIGQTEKYVEDCLCWASPKVHEQRAVKKPR